MANAPKLAFKIDVDTKAFRIQMARTMRRLQRLSANHKKATPPPPSPTRERMTATSPYKILNVTQDADAADVKQAYRLLAKQYHPDVSTNRDNGAASGMFQQIQEAYKLLSDSPKRKRYDAMRRMVEEDADDKPHQDDFLGTMRQVGRAAPQGTGAVSGMQFVSSASGIYLGSSASVVNFTPVQWQAPQTPLPSLTVGSGFRVAHPALQIDGVVVALRKELILPGVVISSIEVQCHTISVAAAQVNQAIGKQFEYAVDMALGLRAKQRVRSLTMTQQSPAFGGALLEIEIEETI